MDEFFVLCQNSGCVQQSGHKLKGFNDDDKDEDNDDDDDDDGN